MRFRSDIYQPAGKRATTATLTTLFALAEKLKIPASTIIQHVEEAYQAKVADKKP